MFPTVRTYAPHRPKVDSVVHLRVTHVTRLCSYYASLLLICVRLSLSGTTDDGRVWTIENYGHGYGGWCSYGQVTLLVIRIVFENGSIRTSPIICLSLCCYLPVTVYCLRSTTSVRIVFCSRFNTNDSLSIYSLYTLTQTELISENFISRQLSIINVAFKR